MGDLLSGNVWKRGLQSEHMVNTEGSVTSLSCLVTISPHEESHQNWEHVEAPAHSLCCHAENAFQQRFRTQHMGTVFLGH